MCALVSLMRVCARICPCVCVRYVYPQIKIDVAAPCGTCRFVACFVTLEHPTPDRPETQAPPPHIVKRLA